MNAHTTQNTSSWWPRLVIAAFIGFALFIGNMVRQAMKTEVDLVSKDYYQKEIAYQKHINQVQATRQLANQVIFIQAAAAEQLHLVFPAGSSPAQVKGQVHFFRPSNARLDFTLPLQLNPDGRQHIRTTSLAKGRWRVQLTWHRNGQDYFLEKTLTL
jgi:hypothetical protein